MNHGGIGVLEHIRGIGGLRLFFKDDILQTLSINEKSTLDGVFYQGRPEEQNERTTVDFVLSPIPYRFWPKVGRIRVRLLGDSFAIAEFSKFLANSGVSILHSEYSRSGYRFATWNFVVAFNVEVLDSDFDKNETAYKPALAALDKIRMEIVTKVDHLLFHDKDDVRFRDSLDIWPITPLAYFYHHSTLCRNKEEDGWLYLQFAVESSGNEITIPDGNLFTSILANQNKFETQPKLNVYVDISTTDVMLRIAIIPSREEWRFSKLTVEYVRNSPPDTSRGFCAQVTNGVSKDIKIWKLTNYTKVNTGFSEIGGASLLLEDQRKRPEGINERESCHKEILRAIRDKGFSVEGGEPFDIETKQEKLDSKQAWSIMNYDLHRDEFPTIKWDIFLSYAEADADIAEKLYDELFESDLSCFLARKELRFKGGVNFSDYIRDQILSSREMILLCSENSINREWVISEWSAAWVLKKMITPVIYRISMKSLPSRLQMLQSVDVHDFKKFVQEAASRK